MPITVLLGAQWGDEGKGRITDALAKEVDIVARFNGGDNAGHSLTIGSQVVRLHLLPSGIFHDACLNIIGNGVVVNPLSLLKEIAEVNSAGVSVTPRRLRISHAAHVILPGHRALDAAYEAAGGIGTTLRGIGPAYSDKAARFGIRCGSMANPDDFAMAVRAHTLRVNAILTRVYDRPPLDAESVAEEYRAAAHQLAPFLEDTAALLHNALAQGQRILAEGAQAALLDIDHGTYPFVTSSNATIGGVLTGLGVPPRAIGRVIGVAKAFNTRVGGGPFVTELEGDLAARLRGSGANPWDEYGSTTGRPRRVGWLDLVALRHAVRLNGIDELALTKLDVLRGLPELHVCIAYRFGDRVIDHFPQDSALLARCTPVYQTLPGWQDEVSHARCPEDLPAEAHNFIATVERFAGAPVSLVSVGPEREQLIRRQSTITRCN